MDVWLQKEAEACRGTSLPKARTFLEQRLQRRMVTCDQHPERPHWGSITFEHPRKCLQPPFDDVIVRKLPNRIRVNVQHHMKVIRHHCVGVYRYRKAISQFQNPNLDPRWFLARTMS